MEKLLVRCGVCGELFDETDEELKARHDFRHATQNDLEIPSFVRDAIRRWADETLRGADEAYTPKQLEEIDVARWVMMHMWWNEEHRMWKNRDEGFAHYIRELRKRYPHSRDNCLCGIR